MSSIISNYFPPTRAQWELLVWGFSILPYATIGLYFRPLILMGKHSTTSRLNINGRFGWFIMEVPGFLTLWAVLLGVKQQLGIETLPRMNYLMASLYVSSSLKSAKLLTCIDCPLHLSFYSLTNLSCTKHQPIAHLCRSFSCGI